MKRQLVTYDPFMDEAEPAFDVDDEDQESVHP